MPKLSGEYDFREIEPKWQKFWLEKQTFRVVEDSKLPKYYILDMFPYPSGDGLHVGHPEGYTATDILARYKRMRGFNVLHPMGWDAFGLPAEQHAIRTGTHPKVTTRKNIERFRQQILSLGFSYDWSREINTSSEEYYRWTQWIFLQLFKRGLAYESYEPVNWCPELGAVLANEEVVDGKSEIGGHPVIKKPLRQWVLKITAYSERLLKDLEPLDWPESIKEMQRNWIGKSVGAEVKFQIKDSKSLGFSVFTTRPDTLFGATFCVLAPEHPLLSQIVTKDQKKTVTSYQKEAAQKADIERTSEGKEKTGVFSGSYAINPINGESIPIWIADYVLMTYGTGAIMAVPGHDVRDHAFAKKYGLPIRRVLTGGDVEDIEEAAHAGEGQLIQSGFLNGLSKSEAIERAIEWLERQQLGTRAVRYKLRDWLFSRQRYWGEPIPLAHDKDGNVVALKESDLPLTLPAVEDFKPSGSGESPLAKATDWLVFKDDQGNELKRETNTMPQWAGSCWYYLRFLDPKNTTQPWDREKERYWMPVDLYVGGAEHAVLHLLYARFWHKVLYDAGLVTTVEPFQKLINQGMILGENNEKMSKSRGNVINPDDVVAEWGADSLRLYEMFMGPLEASKPWQTSGIAGVFRFLGRVWRLYIQEGGSLSSRISQESESEEITRKLHKTLKQVGENLEDLKFNTAISAMMEFVNVVYKDEKGMTPDSAKSLILMLSPFAPHFGEELWQRLGASDSLAYHPWPKFDPKWVVEDKVTVSVQINGKARGTIEVSKDAPQTEVLQAAKQLPAVQKHLEGKTLVKEIYVPGRIISLVVK